MGPFGRTTNELGEGVRLTGAELVEQKLEELRAELQNYFGLLNEIMLMNAVAKGSNSNKKPRKPEALWLYEQCKQTGLPLVSGGVLDQPHIWLQEYMICEQETTRFANLREAANRSKQE